MNSGKKKKIRSIDIRVRRRFRPRINYSDTQHPDFILNCNFVEPISMISRSLRMIGCLTGSSLSFGLDSPPTWLKRKLSGLLLMVAAVPPTINPLTTTSDVVCLPNKFHSAYHG